VKKSKYRNNIEKINESSINHGSGIKKVFIKNEDSDTALTQFAWSKLEAGEYCEKHSHPTMDEYFFVLRGSGKYTIGNKKLKINSGDFIRIPAGTPHKLQVDKYHQYIELVYFGIAVDN
jgi:quercetin dioxygenase-like cupin family protein